MPGPPSCAAWFDPEPDRPKPEMDIAIGLPNAVPGTPGEQLAEWARRAEARGFSGLGTIDRIAYPNLEPLTSLALAKQVATVHKISEGRMTLGIGLGGREDDYEVAGGRDGEPRQGPRRDAGRRRGGASNRRTPPSPITRSVTARGGRAGLPDGLLGLARRRHRQLHRRLRRQGPGGRPGSHICLRRRRLPGALPLSQLKRPPAG